MSDEQSLDTGSVDTRGPVKAFLFRRAQISLLLNAKSRLSKPRQRLSTI
jgi:hypothetical protein